MFGWYHWFSHMSLSKCQEILKDRKSLACWSPYGSERVGNNWMTGTTEQQNEWLYANKLHNLEKKINRQSTKTESWRTRKSDQSKIWSNEKGGISSGTKTSQKKKEKHMTNCFPGRGLNIRWININFLKLLSVKRREHSNHILKTSFKCLIKIKNIFGQHFHDIKAREGKKRRKGKDKKRNYRPKSLMNIDARIDNTLLQVKYNSTLKESYTMIMGFVPVIQE